VLQIATGIDQMTNLPGYQYKVGVKHSLLSDHYAQEMEVYMKIRTGISYKEVRDLSDDNVMGLCTLLKNKAWEDVIGETDVNKIWENVMPHLITFSTLHIHLLGTRSCAW
jgi:hypothetical protein